MQIAIAEERVDEAMISFSIAERQRDVAEAQLQLAAQEKVTALVQLSELTAALHDKTNTQEQQVCFVFFLQPLLLQQLRLIGCSCCCTSPGSLGWRLRCSVCAPIKAGTKCQHVSVHSH